MDGQLCPYSKTELMCDKGLECSNCDIMKEFWKREVTPKQKALDYTQQYLNNPLSSDKIAVDKEQLERFKRNLKK